MPARKCRRCAAGIPHQFQHGSLHSYFYHDCRCLECKRGARAQVEKWRSANPDHSRSYVHHTPEQRRDYYARNKGDFRRHYSKTVDKFNRAAGHSSRRCWTPEEDAVVLRTDLTLLEISYLLRRNRGSILYRRGRLRKELSAIEGKP